MEALHMKIFNRIKEKKLKAFTTADFMDLGNYKGISKALETLEKQNKIRRVMRGMYDCPAYSELFKMYAGPDIEAIAKALARQYNWDICPSGNYALNLMGLDTQVPARYVFLSSGPYKSYTIGKLTFIFKHTTSKQIGNHPYKVLLAIQAIKALGKEDITERDLKKINKCLDEEDRDYIIKNNLAITSWIYDILKEMVGGKDNV